MKKDKFKGTVERELDAMTPEQRKEYEKEYLELALSEIILAAKAKDVRAILVLAQLAKELHHKINNKGINYDLESI